MWLFAEDPNHTTGPLIALVERSDGVWSGSGGNCRPLLDELIQGRVFYHLEIYDMLTVYLHLPQKYTQVQTITLNNNSMDDIYDDIGYLSIFIPNKYMGFWHQPWKLQKYRQCQVKKKTEMLSVKRERTWDPCVLGLKLGGIVLCFILLLSFGEIV